MLRKLRDCYLVRPNLVLCKARSDVGASGRRRSSERMQSVFPPTTVETLKACQLGLGLSRSNHPQSYAFWMTARVLRTCFPQAGCKAHGVWATCSLPALVGKFTLLNRTKTLFSCGCAEGVALSGNVLLTFPGSSRSVDRQSLKENNRRNRTADSRTKSR